MSSCFRVNPPAWNTIFFRLLCNPILILIVYWCRRRQVFKCEFWRSVNWQNPYMLSYEFVPFGSVLQEKIENDCDTILDKTCWHMLKKGTFPPNFLNKSPLLWNKVSVAPLPPEQCCDKRFPYSTEKFRWQWAQHATPNQHCPGERGFVSTVLSKIVVSNDSRPLLTTFEAKITGYMAQVFGGNWSISTEGQFPTKHDHFWGGQKHTWLC